MIGKFRSGEVSVQGIPISLFFFGIYNLHGICQSTRKNHAKVEIHDFHRTQGKCIKKEKLGGIFDGKQPAHNCKVCIFISAYLIFFLLMSFNLTSFSQNFYFSWKGVLLLFLFFESLSVTVIRPLLAFFSLGWFFSDHFYSFNRWSLSKSLFSRWCALDGVRGAQAHLLLLLI